MRIKSKIAKLTSQIPTDEGISWRRVVVSAMFVVTLFVLILLVSVLHREVIDWLWKPK